MAGTLDEQGASPDDATQELAPRARRRLSRLRALVAPVATDAGSVVDDPGLLDVARAVSDAFLEGDASGGLTHAQIVERVDDRVPHLVLESRLTVFEKLGFLRTYLDKKHQRRYTIEPTSLIGQEVFERISVRGGVDELVSLLVRTRALLEGKPTEEEIRLHLRELRGVFCAYANQLDRLVATAPLHELLDERADHDRAVSFDDLDLIAAVVTERFGQLQSLATDVIEEAQRYLGAVQSMMRRILDEGGRSLDFSILAADDYLTAAIDAPVDVLAAVFERVVFRHPVAWVGAADVLGASGRPDRLRKARRPSEPPPSVVTDPLAPVLEAAEARRRRRALTTERLLQGEHERELTATVQALEWHGAARLLADLLAVDLDPDLGFLIEIGEATFVDPEGAVSYASPTTLHRKHRHERHDTSLTQPAVRSLARG